MTKTLPAFVTLLFICLFAVPAWAQQSPDVWIGQSLDYDPEKPVSNEQANEYYERCMEEPDPILNEQAQTEMCACFGANFKQVMLAGELEWINEASPRGDEVRSKVLVYVHAPCIELPVKEIVRRDCLYNKTLWRHIPDMDALCNCLAKDIASFVFMYGPDLYAKIRQIQRNFPTSEDPVQAIMDSSDFKREHRDVQKACLDKYETELDPPKEEKETRPAILIVKPPKNKKK